MKFLQQHTDTKGTPINGAALHTLKPDGTTVCGVGGENYRIVEKAKFTQSQICWNCRTTKGGAK